MMENDEDDDQWRHVGGDANDEYNRLEDGRADVEGSLVLHWNEINNENEMCESVRPTHPSIHTHDNHEGSDGWRAEREAERT